MFDSHFCFTAAITKIQEPTTYKQASQHPEWVQAMQLELVALEKTETLELVDLPKDKHCIGSKLNGYTRLTFMQMALYRGIKPDLWLRGIHRRMALIILILFLM